MPREYVQFVRNTENGLNQSLSKGNFTFKLQYKPLDYIALLEQKNNATHKTISIRKKDLAGLQYYNVRIQSNLGEDVLKSGITEEKEYYNRLNYLSTFLKNDLFVIQGADTLKPVLYLFERNYGLAPFCTSVIAFKETDSLHKFEKKFIIDEQAFIGEQLQFTITKKDLKNIPILQF